MIVALCGIYKTDLADRRRVEIGRAVIGRFAADDYVICDNCTRKVGRECGFARAYGIAKETVFVVKNDVIAENKSFDRITIREGDAAVVNYRVVFDNDIRECR